MVSSTRKHSKEFKEKIASNNTGGGDQEPISSFENGSNGSSVHSNLRPRQQPSSTNIVRNQRNSNSHGGDGGGEGGHSETVKLPSITIQNSNTHLTTYAEKAKSSITRKWL